MTGRLVLLKVGGAELEPGPSLDAFVKAAALLAIAHHLILVHGGGPEIASLQHKLGITPRAIDGLRVTDNASLEAAEMVLSGLVNKRLVGRLVAAGVRALGISGVDAGLLQAKRISHPSGDLGLVGEIVSVNTDFLGWILAGGYTPVISPISTGKDDLTLNVNADHAAYAIARAMHPDEAIYLTNVPGVLKDNVLQPQLTEAAALEMIADGTITGGMLPKVQSALEALRTGVRQVMITNLEGLQNGTGTWFLSKNGEAS